MIRVILGAQWGDEGKGKFTDYFSQNADYCIRFQGGNNAGHTIVIKDKTFKLRMIPSGILTGSKCIIGAGTAVNLDQLEEEVEMLRMAGVAVDESNLFIDSRATLIIPFIYPKVDALREKLTTSPIGTTKNGIGIAYEDKATRIALRAEDILNLNFSNIESITQKYASLTSDGFNSKEDAKNELIQWCQRKKKVWSRYIKNCTCIIYNAFNENKNVIIEGAQGAMLDNTLGTYPYVTSSFTTVGGVMNGIGCALPRDYKTLGVFKAYTTRVGRGPFPSEIAETEAVASIISEKGHEFGTVTGRKRRIGWLDLDVLKETAMFNGYTELAITKADVMSGLNELKLKLDGEYISLKPWEYVVSEGKLSTEFLQYLDTIEDFLGIKVKYVSYSPERNDIIEL